MKPDCPNCPWADPKTKAPRHTPVLGALPSLDKTIGVLVGEAPGAEDVESGIPLSGRTGVWLNNRLEENDIPRHRLAIINAQACVPVKELKNDNTMREATRCCSNLFNRQYTNYSKLPTLAMGKWATSAANNGKPITVETGRGFLRGNLLVTYNPTYAAFYNPWKAGEFVNDLERFKRMLSGKLEASPEVIIRGQLSDFVRLIESPYVKTNGVSVDLETRPAPGHPDYEGKDPYRAAIKTIALGSTTLGIAHWWGSNPKVQSYIIKVLQDKSIIKVFHNGWMFDQPILERYGVRLTNCRDTRDERRAVSATSKLSLRHLTSVMTDFPPWKETNDDK